MKQRLQVAVLIVFLLALIGTIYAVRTLPAEELTPGAYERLRTEVVARTLDTDPRATLDWLMRKAERDERVLRSCHALVHEIGHTAYEKYGDVAEALTYRDEVCGSGYIHGIIESYIEEVGYTDGVLEALCEKSTDATDRANCFHGAGHGLMYYTGNSLPESLAACDSLKNTSDQLRCAEGVFMENFGSDAIFHPSEYVDTVDTNAICRAQMGSIHKGACYFYAPLYYLNLHSRAYDEAFALCENVEPGYQRTCVKGTASRVTKENIFRISYAEAICARQGDMRFSCAEGIGSYHFTHYSDKEKTRALCASLRPEFRDSCEKTLSP